MVAFLIRRVFGMIIVLLAVSFLTYLIFFKIPGGDPAQRIAGRTATLLLRKGFVTAEFIDLAGKSHRDQAEEARLDQLKADLAQRVLAAPAEDVYDLAD